MMQLMSLKENRVIILWRFLLAALSGILLALSYPHYNYFLFVWIFSVPLLFAVRNTSATMTYLLSLVGGMSMIIIAGEWLGNLAITYLNWPDWLGIIFTIFYAFWYGHVFVCAFMLFRFLERRIAGWSLLLFPSSFVFVMSLFPEIFRVNFAVTQLDFPIVIQLVEFVGPWGLCWLILFFNYFIFSLLSRKTKLKSKTVAYTTLFLVLWLVLGQIQLTLWQNKIDHWEQSSVSFIQPNREAILGPSKPIKGYSRTVPLEMGMTESLTKQSNINLVIWPEGKFFGTYFFDDVLRSFQEKVKKFNINLVFQDITLFKNQFGEEENYNSVLWMDPKGEIKGLYHKNILMPFGEYVPLAGYFEPLMKLFNFSIASFQFGKEFAHFDIEPFRIVPIICYEGIVPEYVAKSIGEDGRGKMIVVVSQNGWYRSFAQVSQHSQIVSFRAVENRVPVLHVINNGSTSLTLPDGRIWYLSEYEKKMAETIIFPFDNKIGGSFYSAHPDLTINIFRIFIIAAFLTACFFRKRINYE